MLLERCTVSRKTPLDGKLEISPEAARRISALGSEISLVSASRRGTARVSALECTCAKAAGGRHVHHFVQSPLLQALAPGSVVELELDDREGGLRIDPQP